MYDAPYTTTSFSFQFSNSPLAVFRMSGAAGSIVTTLKSKIKETADELEKYEGMCEESR